MRIVVLGYIVRGPMGGMAWHHLQYVLGLVRLGHEVRFVEDSEDYPSCFDPARYEMGTDPSYGLEFAANAFDGVGIGQLWSYYDAHTGRWLGPDARDAEEFCRSADVVINVSGANPLRSWTAAPPLRVFIDTDPAFTQIRALTKPSARSRLSEHNAFFTFGENIPTGRSRVPDDGIPWKATRQPVVLGEWPLKMCNEGTPYTTVMQWDSYPPLTYGGLTYGTKSMSFGPYADFPKRAGVSLEVAMGKVSAPRARLRKKGWSIVNPLEIARTPWTYRDYIGASRGEFTVAKQGYVQGCTGWFSERSAAYLASGKPVITENTGFTEWLPDGEGVLAFHDPNSAGKAIREIESDYSRHSAAARRIAEEYFASDRVLNRLLDDAQA
jgi:hypothetical protein